MLNKNSLKTGICFGMTSAIITTLGLMVGLNASTSSRLVVIGGIITIAVADAFSDALGIHISEEAKHEASHNEVWEATVITFLAKFFFALTFMVPVLFFSMNVAVWCSVFWGASILSFLSYFIARSENENPGRVIGEHLLIAGMVVTITNYLGKWVSQVFS